MAEKLCYIISYVWILLMYCYKTKNNNVRIINFRYEHTKNQFNFRSGCHRVIFYGQQCIHQMCLSIFYKPSIGFYLIFISVKHNKCISWLWCYEGYYSAKLSVFLDIVFIYLPYYTNCLRLYPHYVYNDDVKIMIERSPKFCSKLQMYL